MIPGPIAQWVVRPKCCRSRGHKFDPGPVPYFMEVDHDVISTVILHFLLIQEGLLLYVHKLLVNRIVKLAQKKVWSVTRP